MMNPKYYHEEPKTKIIDVIVKDYGYLVFYMCGDPKGVNKTENDLKLHEKEEIKALLESYEQYK